MSKATLTEEQYADFMREQRIHHETMRLKYEQNSAAAQEVQRALLEAVREGQRPHVEIPLRDYFAGQALVSAMAFGVERNLSERDMAESSYVMADAMLAAREDQTDDT